MAIVHAYSVHHYQLAYWLASAGVVPGDVIDFVVVSPSLMPLALKGGQWLLSASLSRNATMHLP